MFVAIGRYELFIPASESLKDKRKVLRSVTMVVNRRFNASISEVGHQDKWQRAALGVSCVSSSADHARRMLEEIERTMEKVVIDGAEFVGREVEVIAMEDL